jgi:transcriptional regulator with XRE-family HTH domain
MNMQAVGTYIKTLRLAHELTAHEVGITAGTNATYVWRVENNQLKSPGMDLIMRIVAAVRGRGNDILELMVAENPTDDYARALAKQAQLTVPKRSSKLGIFSRQTRTPVRF